jgi:hypothetical protein
MNVNTAGPAMGAIQSEMSASGDRPEHVVEGNKDNGQSLSVRTSGANATPREAKVDPKIPIDERGGLKLDKGPNVDPKTNAYRKSVYEQTVRHNSEGGATTLIREDR